MKRKIARFSAALSIFLAILTAEAQDVNVPGNLNMNRSSNPRVGNILKGGTPFLHNFGAGNTFLGEAAGNFRMSGGSNTATGALALIANTTGSSNTASGSLALVQNTTGGSNTAIGEGALLSNRTGGSNTAIGRGALNNNQTGSGNTAIGSGANVGAINLTNATAIGAGAGVDASNKIRLGNEEVTVIEGLVGFTANSDRNRQENFLAVRGEEVLRKIRDLSLTSWNYVGQEPTRFRHYGPAAQDFFDAFGNDGIGTIGAPNTITSTDMEGILMVAVQALERRTEENDELKARLEALEHIVSGEVAGR